MNGACDYGNARVRAMRARLLDAQVLEGLLDRDVDGLLAALAETDYGPDVQAALPRHAGLRRVHEAVRTHLARALRRVLSFYAGRPAGLLGLLVARHDVHNVLAVLRALARRTPGEEATGLTVPAGAFSDAQLVELASQPDVRSAVELLAAWRMPDPLAAAALVSALPDAERAGSVEPLEATLAVIYTTRAAAALTDGGPDERVVAALLGPEVDRDRLLAALRAREDQEDHQPAIECPPFPGAVLSADTVATAARAASRAEANAVLSVASPRWARALDTWEHHGDLAGLHDAIDAALAAEAAALAATSDPLGIGIPATYIRLKENEARNVLLAGAVAGHGLDPAVARRRLVLLKGA